MRKAQGFGVWVGQRQTGIEIEPRCTSLGTLLHGGGKENDCESLQLQGSQTLIEAHR